LRPKDLCRLAIGSAAVFVFIFLVPQQAAAQVGNAANQPTDLNVVTSVRGPLQQRLETAFPDSFKSGVDIFWEPRDGWVSPKVVEWWKLRVADEDHAGLNPEAAERMFSRFAEQTPIFPRSKKRRICAVVGASRNLLGSRYGNLIDAHRLVFRVNRAPTDGFDVDVGTKTSHHVTWPRDLEEWEFDRGAYLLMSPIAANNLNIFDRISTLVEEDLRWDSGLVRIIHPEFFKYVHENWTEERVEYPSTGLITLMIALHVCDEVNVFGFGADAQGRWDRYYEDVPEDVSSFHPVDFEGWLRREMEKKGILKVFRGSRPDLAFRPEPSLQD